MSYITTIIAIILGVLGGLVIAAIILQSLFEMRYFKPNITIDEKNKEETEYILRQALFFYDGNIIIENNSKDEEICKIINILQQKYPRILLKG